MFIGISIAVLIVVQLALWFAIKRFRPTPGDNPSGVAPASRGTLLREAAWWFIGTIVVVVLLVLLIERIYGEQRTLPERSSARQVSRTI